ncbi:MAG: Uma2 family endonuclease [Tunicatimonas sp.]
MNETVVSDIMKLPQAPMILEELKQAWAKEQSNRQRFYKEMTEEQKTEFIQGEVIVHSPAKKQHLDAAGNIYTLLNLFVKRHQLGEVFTEKALIQLTRNDFEPDVCFFKRGKSKQFQEDQLFFPAPDLVVEVLSNSTKKRDRGIKLEDYQLHEVEEYWIVDAKQKTVEQYHLEAQQYQLITKAQEGNIRSFAIQGLALPIPAIFDEDQLMQFVGSLFS